MEDLVIINKYVTVNTLETYLEKHPEDTEKWLEHLNPLLFRNNEGGVGRRTYDRVKPNDEDYLKYNIIKNEGEQLTDSDMMCAICKNSWEQTQAHATTTLLCGHKYHTVCYFISYYEGHDGCMIEGCHSETADIISQLYRRRVRLRETVESILIDSLKGNANFKCEVKKIKAKISSINKHLVAFTNAKKAMRQKIIKKHECNLTQIQFDLNNAVKSLQDMDEAKGLKLEIRKYRSIERNFYRRYHLSLHDLRKYRVVGDINWNVRGILMRHYGLNNRRNLGIRLYPGKKSWIKTNHRDNEAGVTDDEVEYEGEDA